MKKFKNIIVKNNENGFLVGISNPKEIASSIEKLTENKKLYLDMSEKSRRLAERNFDEEAIINQTLNLYEK